MIRVYSSISVETILSASITSSQTSIVVATGTASALLGGAPLTPAGVYQFTLALDPDTVNEEIVFATYISGDTFTIVRGRAGTTAITHASGATVRHVLTSKDLDYFNTALQPDRLTAKADLITASAAGTAPKEETSTKASSFKAKPRKTATRRPRKAGDATYLDEVGNSDEQ